MFRYRIARILSVSLILLALALGVVPANASTLGESQQEKLEIDRKLEQEQDNLRRQRNREAELEDELKQLDRRLDGLRSELAQINGEIATTEAEVSRAEEKLAATEAELEGKEALFKRRLRTIYEQGSVSYLDILLGASSFSDFLTRFNNLKIIAGNDQRLIEEVSAERDRILAMKEALEQEKNRLDGMRRKILDNEDALKRTAASRKLVMGELQQEIDRNLKAIRDLERESERLESKIRELIRSTGGGISGKLCYPIEAPTWLSSGFGWRSDPFSGASSWHGGIDLATGGRANYILAAESGRVSLAAWNGGYGNCIIIDHGGGTATLYGHLSSFLVSTGQTVSRGQRIGRAGTTGNSTGVHLHFEVREYNKPPYRYYSNGTPDYRYNPLSYF